MEAILRGLTPSKLSGRPFRVERGEVPFEEWAEENPDSLRRYAFRDVGPHTAPLITNMDLQMEETALELLIIYPKTFRRYGKENIQDARDLIRTDWNLIDGKSGIGINNASGYVSGQHSAVVSEREIVEEEKHLVSRMVIDIQFYRSITA
jgi:hypothetical protein